MYDGCDYCPARTHCGGIFESDKCDDALSRMIERGRIDYYKEWLTYIGDDADCFQQYHA